MLHIISRLALIFALPLFGLELSDLSHLKTDNIQGEWKQEKTIVGLGVIQSSGDFHIRDKTLFWNIKKPIHNEIKIDESGVWSKQNDKWIKNDKDYDKSLFLDIINLNFNRIKSNFDITQSGTKNAWNLTLTPNNIWLEKVFTKIEISGGENLDSLTLYETSGDITKNTFHSIK